jgi:hypothetical protein
MKSIEQKNEAIAAINPNTQKKSITLRAMGGFWILLRLIRISQTSLLMTVYCLMEYRCVIKNLSL